MEHPALVGSEMEAVGYDGYDTVNSDRQMVLEMFTSPEIKRSIEELGIMLISYAEPVR